MKYSPPTRLGSAGSHQKFLFSHLETKDSDFVFSFFSGRPLSARHQSKLVWANLASFQTRIPGSRRMKRFLWICAFRGGLLQTAAQMGD